MSFVKIVLNSKVSAHFDLQFDTKFGMLMCLVSEFPQGPCQMCQPPTTNFFAPNQGVFYHLGLPVNFHFVVEPFGAEKMAPPIKIGMVENANERQNFGMAKKTVLN